MKYKPTPQKLFMILADGVSKKTIANKFSVEKLRDLIKLYKIKHIEIEESSDE